MNKRNLLKASLAAVVALLVPSVSVAKPVQDEAGNFVVFNRIGLPCAYSPEIQRDLLAVHGIDVVAQFKSQYGTRFYISKELISNDGIKDRNGNISLGLLFTLTTNDSRDKPKRWTQSEFNGKLTKHKMYIA
jgi:hypothetical protein